MARFDTRRTNQDCSARGWLTRSQPRSGSRWILVAALLCLAGVSGAQIGAAARAIGQKQATPPPAATTTPSTSTPGQAATPAVPPAPQPDPLGRNTPHGTVLGFLRAAEAQDYVRAGEYLDGKRSPEEAAELARELKALLDQGNINIGSIPRTPEGNLEEPLRVSRESIGIVKTPNGDLNVLLDRVELPNQTPVWRFSQETLTRVPSAYASVQHRDLASYFPAWSARIKFLSVPLWRWALILIAVGGGLLLATLLTRLLVWLLRLLLRGKFTGTVEDAVSRLRSPIFGLMLAAVLDVANNYAFTALGRHFWSRTATLVALVSGAWLIVRLSDIVASFLCQRLTQQMQVERVTFVGLLARLFKILIGIILFIVLLTEAGVNVSALIAGLGIGGIALALAAQKTLADLFGGISVVMRGTIRVGDFCTVAGKQGIVEEIGISSLRLRTLDRSVISIPNAKVAEMELENFSLRDQFWVHPIFTLQFDTSYTSMQTVLAQIVDMLKARPDINPISARARLIQLTPTGPQIEVFAYFQKRGADYAAFLEVQEEVLLEIMRLIEAAGISLAAPIGVVRVKQAERPQAPESIPVDSTISDR